MSLLAPLDGVLASTAAIRARIAVVAHHHRTADVLDWARCNRDALAWHELSATGTTAAMLSRELGLPVAPALEGAPGRERSHGATRVDGPVDFVVLFWDPLAPLPDDAGVRSLLRLALVHDVPIACTRAAADFVVASRRRRLGDAA